MRIAPLVGLLLVGGFTARVACARVGAASEAPFAANRPLAPDDTLAVSRLLVTVRGIDPLLCELATRTVDMHGSWSRWGPFSSDPLERDSAAAELLDWIQEEHRDPAVIPRLRSAMRDSDPCVRRVAGAFLGRVDHPSAVTELLRALDDASADTRVVAAIGLGLAEKPVAVGALVKRLSDESAAVRRVSAWALGAIEDQSALLPLIDALKSDRDARVRQAAAWAIGELHG